MSSLNFMNFDFMLISKKQNTMNKFLIFLLAVVCFASMSQCNFDGSNTLENDQVKLSLDKSGSLTFYDKKNQTLLTLNNNQSQVVIDGLQIDLTNQDICKVKKSRNSIMLTCQKQGYVIDIVYELKDDWRFISKLIRIESLADNKFTVNKLKLFDNKISEEILSQTSIYYKKYGLSLRLKEFENGQPGSACFMTVQNPFTTFKVQDNEVNIAYSPEINWDQTVELFESDRLCFGFADLTGREVRARMIPEWVYVENPDEVIEEGDKEDEGEIEAFTNCMRAFLLVHPQQSNRVHIGWCENDYQIDISTPEGNVEYKRIIDRAAELGSQHVLFTAANDKVAPPKDSRDAWGWENVLWYGLGQKIRKGEWQPGDPLPETIQDIVLYAKAKGVGLMAYVYPSMPFMQNPEWTAWLTSKGREPGGYSTIDTGLKSFQDWFVDMLIAFARETGCTGYSFDHWWIGYGRSPDDTSSVQVSSQYQQWYGCRRILEQLRKKGPDLIIDGRQQYHYFGTWTWLAGTYPHPMMSDEQPGSFNAIPDLSTDRVNGARQRFIAYRLMMHDFTPMEIIPGFITHQTMRHDASDLMRKDRFREKDWDYLGWKYNLLSSIATAPFNHVINYIPARDEKEFESFTEEDKIFFNDWLDFTDKNARFMKNVKPIIGQPMIGRCDGTSAIVEDEGYLFIFNPNYRSLTTKVELNESIGLTRGKQFILKEIYPEEGTVTAQGILNYGDQVELPMPGITAKVFSVELWKSDDEPLLVNSPGEVKIESGKLFLTGVQGLKGSQKEISVINLGNTEVEQVYVNGQEIPFNRIQGAVGVSIRFKGEYFPMASSLTSYDPAFTGSTVEASLRIPQYIFNQLQQRKLDWPISYSDDDRIAPWLEPSRLLLYVQVAEPYHYIEREEKRGDEVITRTRQQPIRKQEYEVKIDGKNYAINEAYNGVYPFVERSNLGMFVDISSLQPDVDYTVTVKLPEGLKPGQFQGLFIEHVENEYTREIF